MDLLLLLLIKFNAKRNYKGHFKIYKKYRETSEINLQEQKLVCTLQGKSQTHH